MTAKPLPADPPCGQADAQLAVQMLCNATRYSDIDRELALRLLRAVTDLARVTHIALKPTRIEAALHAALRRRLIYGDPARPDQPTAIRGAWRGTAWADIPAGIRRAVEKAAPLPGSVTAAKRELDGWIWRALQIAAATGRAVEVALDAPSLLRVAMVRAAFEGGLRATSVAEVLLRQRYATAVPCTFAATNAAITADLETMAERERAVVQNEHTRAQSPVGQTATDRRRAVRATLADPATRDLPLREIAAACSVSPATVLNQRRAMARGEGGA